MKTLIWTHHPGDWLGEAIDFLTHGTAQHAGFMRQNGLIVEAYWPRVRQRAVLEAEKPFIRPFILRGMTPGLDAAFEAEFDRLLAAPPEYSGEDLFAFLFNQPNVDEKHTFCSRLVMHTTMNICPAELWPLVRCMGTEQQLPDGTINGGDWVSPRDLFISPSYLPSSLS